MYPLACIKPAYAFQYWNHSCQPQIPVPKIVQFYLYCKNICFRFAWMSGWSDIQIIDKLWTILNIFEDSHWKFLLVLFDVFIQSLSDHWYRFHRLKNRCPKQFYFSTPSKFCSVLEPSINQQVPICVTLFSLHLHSSEFGREIVKYVAAISQIHIISCCIWLGLNRYV